MSELIACFQKYWRDDVPDHLPSEVHYFSQPNGKVFMHMRGRCLRLDRWFADFNEAALSIEKLVNTGFYRMRGSYAPGPYDVPLFQNQKSYSTVYTVDEIDRELVAP